MGTVVAIREDTPRVANTSVDSSELIDNIGNYESELDVINRLETFRQALREVESPALPDARYFLLELDSNAGLITVSGFKAYELGRATTRYAEAEKKIAESGGDAVLVSVDSLTSLRRAYPNYFLDTRVFLDLLEDILKHGI
jgi:hypothetical protein